MKKTSFQKILVKIGVLAVAVILMSLATVPAFAAKDDTRENVNILGCSTYRKTSFYVEKDGLYTFESKVGTGTVRGVLYTGYGGSVIAQSESGSKTMSMTVRLTAGSYLLEMSASYYDNVIVYVYYQCEHPEDCVSIDAGKEATCISEGLTPGEYCSDCEKWYIGHEVIPVNSDNHKNLSVIANSETTCTKMGRKAKYCSDCKQTFEETMPSPAHIDLNFDKKCDNCKVAMVTGSYKQQHEDPIKYTYTPMAYTGMSIKPEFDFYYYNFCLYNPHDYEIKDYDKNVNASDNAEIECSIYPTSYYDEDDPESMSYDSYHEYGDRYFSILRADISSATIEMPEKGYLFNSPAIAEPLIKYKGNPLYNGKDYVIQYFNNYDVGTATARIYGIGNFKGYVDKTFTVVKGDTSGMTVLENITDYRQVSGTKNYLTFSYNSQFDEAYVATVGSKIKVHYDAPTYYTPYSSIFTCNGEYVESYEGTYYDSFFEFTKPGKYRVLLYAQESHYTTEPGWGVHGNGAFGQVNTTSSSRVNVIRFIDIYVVSSTAMTAPKTLVASEPVVNETNYAYLRVGTNDTGNVNLKMDSWTVSDSSVATVNNGFVSFKKPGTVTVTAKKGSLQTSWKLEKKAINLVDNAKFIEYVADGNKVTAVCNAQLLGENDINVYVIRNSHFNIVTIEGKNFFTGKITKLFSNQGDPRWCKHTYKTTTKAATCTATGTKTYNCTKCLYSKEETIKALGHSYSGSYSVVKAATPSSDGSIAYPCTRSGCTAQNTKTVKKIGSVALSATSYVFNSKTKTPSVTVKNSSGSALKSGVDYTVNYEAGRINPGRYTVKVTFKGKYSGTKKLSFTIKPQVTNKISASQTTNSVTLKWNKVTGATGYTIYQYNEKTKKWVTVKTLTATSLTVKNLKAGTVYKFKIKAYKNDEGTISGAASGIFTTATKPATPKITKLTTTKGKATLNWSNVSGESGYEVYYSANKNSGFKQATTTNANVVKASKSKLTSGKTYYFKVRAYKTVDGTKIYSAWSAVKSVKIK